LQYGHFAERFHHLEGTTDPFATYFMWVKTGYFFSVKEYLSSSGLIYSNDKVKSAGFSRTIRPNQTNSFP
jgi:hypothetical protein